MVPSSWWPCLSVVAAPAFIWDGTCLSWCLFKMQLFINPADSRSLPSARPHAHKETANVLLFFSKPSDGANIQKILGKYFIGGNRKESNLYPGWYTCLCSTLFFLNKIYVKIYFLTLIFASELLERKDAFEIMYNLGRESSWGKIKFIYRDLNNWDVPIL